MANIIRWIIIIILVPLVPFILIPLIGLFLLLIIAMLFFILPICIDTIVLFIDGIGLFGLGLIVLFFVAKRFFKRA